MMILIMVVSGVSVYYFFKTYKKEMREKELRIKEKMAKREEKTDAAS